MRDRSGIALVGPAVTVIAAAVSYAVVTGRLGELLLMSGSAVGGGLVATVARRHQSDEPGPPARPDDPPAQPPTRTTQANGPSTVPTTAPATVPAATEHRDVQHTEPGRSASTVARPLPNPDEQAHVTTPHPLALEPIERPSLAKTTPASALVAQGDPALSIEQSDDGTWLVARRDPQAQCRLGEVPCSVAALPVTARAHVMRITDREGATRTHDLAQRAASAPTGVVTLLGSPAPSESLVSVVHAGVIAAVWAPRPIPVSPNLHTLLRSTTDLALPGRAGRHAADALLLLCIDALGLDQLSVVLIAATSECEVTVARRGPSQVSVTEPTGRPAIDGTRSEDVVVVAQRPGAVVRTTFDDGAVLAARLTDAGVLPIRA